MRGRGFKLKEDGFRLDVKMFFTMRAVRLWHRFPERWQMSHF